jgi:hypothetical protein
VLDVRSVEIFDPGGKAFFVEEEKEGRGGCPKGVGIAA